VSADLRRGVALCLLTIVLALLANWKWGDPRVGPTGKPICQEDQRCWDCHTMGNRICGPGKG
jgi:hypothetical protein